MSRTKRKAPKEKKPAPAQHHDHDQPTAQDHPIEKDRAETRIPRPASARRAKGAEQRRGSYGYRTSQRRGG